MPFILSFCSSLTALSVIMNQESLFGALEVVVRRYAKEPVGQLIDSYLRIKVAYNLSVQAVEGLLKGCSAPASLAAVFTSRSKEERQTNFSCIAIDHPRLLALTHRLLENIPSCIAIDQDSRQLNNVLTTSLPPSAKEHKTKAILLRTTKEDFTALTESLDSYLSICELFHSHIHLTVNCFEAWPTLSLSDLMIQSSGDEFDGVIEDGYFRILQQRASKITLEELSETCEIKRLEGGQMLICEGGQDGLIVWITQRFLPKLGCSPNMAIPPAYSKRFQLFFSSNLGYKIFKARKAMREPMEDLSFTTLIFNFNAFCPAAERIVAQEFERYCRHFFSSVSVNAELRSLEQGIKHGQRICEILGLDEKLLLQKLLCP